LERLVLDGKNCEEYANLQLMRDVYHCTPSEFRKQNIEDIILHKTLLNAEYKRQKIESKRAEQRQKVRNSLS
jgi:hypothetical protein